MISPFALFTCSSALALHLGSTQRLPLRPLTPQDEITHTLRVELGGELGAVRLHAPVSRLTRWPAGDLWPAGRALATRLSAEPGLVRGRRVLELGTGLGIAGIAAADAGARHVFLSGILCGNQVSGASRHGGNLTHTGDIDASAVKLALRSHEELGRSPGRASGARIDFARGGWPAAVRAGAADTDVVIASDVLYSERQAPALARFLADYLADRPRGKGYVMNPLARDKARIGFAFMEEARAFGLHVEAEEYASRASGAADMQLIKVENTRGDGDGLG